MAGYLGGRIKRIKIRNFMTYDHVEIYPKKGLNLIVGLNGSGKSSIMCAICLGLAGKPHFTGRATQLSEFIKHGQPEAEIEIELDSGSKKSMVINRKLRGDKCEWTLNSVTSNQNEVSSAVKEFNIDTSNLCQFLPQEKVVEFSRMDKKQRLENMLQAIGEPHLFELFNELKNLHKSVTEKMQVVKKYENNKSVQEEENERISDEVQKQESRVRLKKQLEHLFKQRTILIYQGIYEEVNLVKEKLKKMQAEMEDIRKEKKEADALEDSIFNLYITADKKYKESFSNRQNLTNTMTNNLNALVNFNEQVENAKIDCRNKITEKNNQQKRAYDVLKQIEGLETVINEERNNLHRYQEEEQLNSQALVQMHEEISELYQNVENAAAEKNQVEYSLLQYKNQLNSLRDEQNKKMSNLKRRDKHTYEAACWVLQNRQCFKANVYLPIMIEINISSNESSKYVENVIGFRDMIAFVCEDKSDCERLTDILKKQQNLPVNIVMAPDTTMSNYVSPQLTADHRQCGLQCFIINLFTAPEPIMRYLCACYGIHRIPVATSAVSGNHIEFILQSFPIFFADNMRVSGKRSRYGDRNLSVKQDFIASQNLLVNTNDELQREVEQKCQEFENIYQAKKRILDEFKAALTEKEKGQEKLRQEKKNLQEKKRNIENVKSKLLQKQRFHAQMTSVVIDEEGEKVKLKKKVQSINELRERVICDLCRFLKEYNELEKEIIKLILGMNSYSKNLKLTKAANEDIHEKVKAAEAELQKLDAEYRAKKRSGRKLYEEIKAMGEEDKDTEERDASMPQDSSWDDSDAELKEEYLKLIEGSKITPGTERSVDEIEENINHIQAQLNLNEDNEPLVAEFNTRKKTIESIQSQIQTFQREVGKIKKKIAVKKKQWLDPLERHIANINRKFSHYFKELSCVGEISLDVPEDPDDFTKYGLRINLKFHDEEASLCELSQTHHSGGECSVAAIVFILSLQELTEVPFRCIDEINQGMDSVNERKIYQLIADSVADDQCSQYFLLTPKLLMDLEYPEDVAVHIIFNSPFMFTKLDVKRHLQIISS